MSEARAEPAAPQATSLAQRAKASYAGAEQAYMAIAPLLEHLAAEGQLADAGRLRPLLAQARATLASEDAYRAERFRDALDALAAAIRAPSRTEG